MTARIYRPSKNAMQSGRGKSQDWVLEFESSAARTTDPLMGYTSSSDMNSQVKLSFATQEEAIAYAIKNNMTYAVQAEQTQKRRAMAYTDNFQFNRVGMWTH